MNLTASDLNISVWIHYMWCYKSISWIQDFRSTWWNCFICQVFTFILQTMLIHFKWNTDFKKKILALQHCCNRIVVKYWNRKQKLTGSQALVRSGQVRKNSGFWQKGRYIRKLWFLSFTVTTSEAVQAPEKVGINHLSNLLLISDCEYIYIFINSSNEIIPRNMLKRNNVKWNKLKI